MRYLGLIIVLALASGCARDPYIARKGGYMPGEPYHHQSGLYPGIKLSRAGA